MRNSKITILGIITAIQKEEIKYTSLALILQKKKWNNFAKWCFNTALGVFRSCSAQLQRRVKKLGRHANTIPACHSSIYNSNNLCQWLRNYCRRDLLYYVCPSISMLPVLQSRGGARSEAITQRLQSEVFILIRRKEQRSYHVLSECCLFIPLEQKKNSKNILI